MEAKKSKVAPQDPPAAETPPAAPVAGTIDNTADARPRTRAQELSDLYAKMAQVKCRHCAQIGFWVIAHTEGRVRLLRCKACGRHGAKVSV
jgi:hypothetical protein